MNIKYLLYFKETVDNKSFTKAAEKLYVSQSALSKGIKCLERELNCILIDRFTKEFSLTKEGEILHQMGGEMLNTIKEYECKIYDCIKNCKGSLRVGIPPVIATAYFAPIVYQFENTYKNVDFKVFEAGAKVIKKMIDEHSIDIGIVILPFDNCENYHIEPLISSENMLVVHKDHPLATRKVVKFKELKNENFLMLDNTYMLYDRIISLCEQVGFYPNIIGESAQWDFLVEIVSCNQGICILPLPILRKIHLDNIRCIALTEPEFPWDIAMITKKEHYCSKPMKYFKEFTLSSMETLRN